MSASVGIGHGLAALASGRDLSAVSVQMSQSPPLAWRAKYASDGDGMVLVGQGGLPALSLQSFVALVAKLISRPEARPLSLAVSVCPVTSDLGLALHTMSAALAGCEEAALGHNGADAVSIVFSGARMMEEDDDDDAPASTAGVVVAEAAGSGSKMATDDNDAAPAPAEPAIAPATGDKVVVRKQPSKAQLVISPSSAGSGKHGTGSGNNDKLQAAVAAVLAVTEGTSQELISVSMSVRAGPSVEPTGELQGNCAYASLLRSSNTSTSSGTAASGKGGMALKEEKRACQLMRRAVVASMARRLLHIDIDITEGQRGGDKEEGGRSFRDTILAVNLSSDDGGSGSSGLLSLMPSSSSSGGAKGKAKKPQGGKTGAAEKDDEVKPPAWASLSPEWLAAVGYLKGQLCLGTGAPASSQYAGPLELSALSSLLRRDVIIFAEQGSRDDGAVFLYHNSKEEKEEKPLFPLVAVNTRRRHMYPLVLSSSTATTTTGSSSSSGGSAAAGRYEAAAVTLEHLEGLAKGQVEALRAALDAAPAVDTGKGKAMGTGKDMGKDEEHAALAALLRAQTLAPILEA